jgi:pimeloyl-ACP methyl ester carboxylesterase
MAILNILKPVHMLLRIKTARPSFIRYILILYISACAGKSPGQGEETIKDGTAAISAAKIQDTMGERHTTNVAEAVVPDPFPAGKIIDPVICRSDPSQSYALYIPASGKAARPAIYFFDPHAVGALPLEKYRSLADAYGFILIGSNNSKNGNDWASAESIWQHLSTDTKDRLKIDKNRIYTCGFSGGAKVAGYVALQHPEVKAVIANGAGMPDGTPAGDFNFSFTAIAGEGDMNMTDLVVFSKELDKGRTRHHLILFDGKHEWAPENTMEPAFAGLQLDAMRRSLIPKDEAFIKSYIVKSKKRLDAHYKNARLIRAGQECLLSISLLEGLSGEMGWFKEKLASLAGDAQYQKQQQAEQELMIREQNTKAEYSRHFQQDDAQYWVTIINDLQIKARAGTVESGMNQRLLAYLSLAFYSYSNQLIGQNENAVARHFVELYKMADPTNPEAWYFSAILHARDNQAKDAEDDLLKAAGDGFRDESRMMQQPEFQNLSPQIDFSRIEAIMHPR